MGSKTAAREAAMAAGVPVVPGTTSSLPADTPERDVLQIAAGIGYPVMIKAVAGGGGKGMRLVANADELGGALRAARSEALSAFGDGAVYLERRLERPRHIEVQLLGDEHGTVVPFVERECSMQRRHQKVLEESPSTAVDLAAASARWREAAARIARAVGYTNAGTIEFLLDADGTLLLSRDEHALAGRASDHGSGDRNRPRAVAVPARAKASVSTSTRKPRCARAVMPIEVPDLRRGSRSGFLPSPGRITQLRVPAGPGVRDDGGYEPDAEVPIYYDSLISKLIAWGGDRPEAIARLQRALTEYEIAGIRTTIPFFTWLLAEPDFVTGNIDTTSLDRVLAEPQRHAVQGARRRRRRRRRHCRGGRRLLPKPLQRRIGRRSGRQRVDAKCRAAKPFADACAFEIEVGGRVREVAIEPRGATIAVVVDGSPVNVEIRPVGGGRFSLRFPGTGRQQDVVVARGRDGEVDVLVGGLRVPARLRPNGRGSRAARSADAPDRVVAPMPGKVVKLLVKAGDHVDRPAGRDGR